MFEDIERYDLRDLRKKKDAKDRIVHEMGLDFRICGTDSRYYQHLSLDVLRLILCVTVRSSRLEYNLDQLLSVRLD